MFLDVVVVKKRPPWLPDPETILAGVLALEDERVRRWGAAQSKRSRDYQARVRRRKAERFKEAWRERELLTVRRWRGARPWEGVRARVLKFMEPGRWYALPDLERAIGAGRDQRRGAEALWKQGLVERVRDPNPPARRQYGYVLLPVAVYLYRLTKAGEVERDWWRLF